MKFKSVISDAQEVGTNLESAFDEGWLPLTFIGQPDGTVLLVFQKAIQPTGAEDLEALFGQD